MLDRTFSAIFATQWHVFFVLLALLLGSAEAGFRIGLRQFRRPEAKSRQGQVGTLEGALLGLLGLLLGFTFAMAVSRFEARRQLVIDEANAIGTTWLRASFLGAPVRDEVRAVLRDYVEARLDLFATTATKERRGAAPARAAADQSAMWRIAEAASQRAPSLPTAQFVDSLNAMIDLDAERVAATRDHVPSSVWLLLMIVSATVCGCCGYGTSVGAGQRLAMAQLLLPLLVTIVITIISDLDRPRRGLITESQESMAQVQALMEGNR